MVEYAVLLSLIALALVGPVFGLGQQVGNRFQSITNELANDSGGTTPPPTTPDPETPTTPDPETPTTPDPEPETGGTVDPSKTPLKDVTWEELDKLSPDAGKNPDKYKDWIGQSIPDGNMEWVLIGTGHDDLADGSGKAGFTFMSRYTLTGTGLEVDPFSSHGIDNWGGSDLRNETYPKLLTKILNASKNGLKKSMIKTVKKPYMTSSNVKTRAVAYADDNLWALSAIEAGGDDANNVGTMYVPKYAELAGSQYEGFASGTTYWPFPMQNLNLDSGNITSADRYLGISLRSVWPEERQMHFTINGTGTPNSGGDFQSWKIYDNTRLLPCFCI